jgi:hypothetical protein
MTSPSQLSYEDWVERYRPIKNPVPANSAFDGTMFETFGKEHDFVRAQPTDKIWTLLEEDGTTWIASGYHFVNRLGYFITEEPAPDELIEIIIDEPEELDHDVIRRLSEVAATLVGTTEKAVALDFNLLGHDIQYVLARLADAQS